MHPTVASGFPQPALPAASVAWTGREPRTTRAPEILGPVLFVLTLSAAAVATHAIARHAVEALTRTVTPVVGGVDVHAVFFDGTPVRLTTSAAWAKVPLVVAADRVRSDVTVWRRMRLEDWDTVRAPLRTQALDAMLARYRTVLASPDTWDRMTPDDWDLVPHPVRALAFRHMAAYWSGFYQVGAEHGIPPRTMSDTLAAVLMTESWFEHRALHVNPWGNRDLGVAQAADPTRERMIALHREGAVDVLLLDDDYFDPWKATRFVALWMARLLEDTGGDLDTAVRAYHRGSARALRGEGEEYLAMVKRRLHRYIRNDGRSPAWDHLWRRDRALIAEWWPWLAADARRRRSTVPAEPPTTATPAGAARSSSEPSRQTRR